ncbi:nucleoside deaminase [Oscillospiraceae bacterium CM]|nr:nucleoside deaminase [Oscillospiraceae bacterium CM]
MPLEHEKYMKEALALAARAMDEGEVPVGCVITDADGAIIGSGWNRREQAQSALGHAELMAIEEACRHQNDWRLSGCSLYVTLEPCPMCAGAIINARLPKLFYGAKEEQTGACGSVINLFMERFGHAPQIVGGILEDDCRALMTAFFKRIRNSKGDL